MRPPPDKAVMRISLEPTSRPGAEHELPLGQQIGRITLERGHFATLTESELENELRKAGSAEDEPGDDHMEADSAMTAPETAPETTPEPALDASSAKSFDEMRAELSQKVRTALNESALSLDFVSLLVSSQRPQVGASSMSPMLKQAVPIGTLGTDTVSESSVTGPKPEAAVAAVGWKLMALENAASTLDQAVTRLRAENSREAMYWRGITRLVDTGEVITRARRGSPLVIKYGFGDSGSTYRHDPGRGVLARGPEGNPVFQPAKPLSGISVRVSVYRVGDSREHVATHTMEFATDVNGDPSNTNHIATSAEESEIAKIKAARNGLFEKELMYHMVQESRLLGSYGVRLIENRIVCEMHGFAVEIGTVGEGFEDHYEHNKDHDEADSGESEKQGEEEAHSNNGGSKDSIAGVINFCFHLLLTAFFRANFNKLHERPEPLKTDQQASTVPAPKPAILRPVLAHLHHSVAVHRVLKLVELMFPGSAAPQLRRQKAGLGDAPKCELQFADITVEVRSPLDEELPVFVAKHSTMSATAAFPTLAELERWLRWVHSA